MGEYDVNPIDVTVLTVAHNAGRFLPACLESVRAQQGVRWEHLVIDNHSSDHGVDYLIAEQRKDSRLRVVWLAENEGCGGGLRHAGPEVQGRFVVFLDADDLMAPDRLARQVEWLEANPAQVAVYGHAEAIREDGTPLGERVFAAGSEDALKRFVEFSMPACHSTGCVRTDFFRKVAARAVYRQAADYDAICRLFDEGPVGFLPEVVSFYRRHPLQVSNTGRVRQACEGAAAGLVAARRRAGLPEHPSGFALWLAGLIGRARSVGMVHAAFAIRSGEEGFARLELYHARRAVRRGHGRSLFRVFTALFSRRAHAGCFAERWKLAWAGPLRTAGIR
jgi:glycosyltransferase involved in cell wall biosynthesis